MSSTSVSSHDSLAAMGRPSVSEIGCPVSGGILGFRHRKNSLNATGRTMPDPPPANDGNVDRKIKSDSDAAADVELVAQLAPRAIVGIGRVQRSRYLLLGVDIHSCVHQRLS